MSFRFRSDAVARLACAGVLAVTVASFATAGAATTGTVGNFAYGELQDQAVGSTGCGANVDGEPAIEISNQNNLFLGSERGLGGGSESWRETPAASGTTASGCSPAFAGQPNAVGGAGASGGDIDVAWGSAPGASGNDPLYVASLNLASVSVAHSTDNGRTFVNVPIQGGLPGDDREWIAAYGSATSLLTFHDIASDDIDVLRSDDGGLGYHQISQAIPATDYRATNNELGNIAIDRINTAGAAPGQFWAYQSYVAPSAGSLTGDGSYNEAFLAVSADGGSTWTQRAIGCSTSSRELDHQFPNVAVDPAGTIWYAWSDDLSVFVAHSSDHGQTWTCETVSTTPQSVMPWLAPASNGVDLVYYATTTAPCSGKSCPQPTWYVYFAQRVNGSWQNAQQLMPVHSGTICEGGIGCSGGRQLYDDFGVDVDRNGYAHIAYSHDSPDLGGSDTYTGYAVQTGGTAVGTTN